MAYKTRQRVSVPNLKLFGQVKTELWAKYVGGFPIMSHGQIGWWAFFFATYRLFGLEMDITLSFIGILT